MLKNKPFFILFISFKLMTLKAQSRDKIRFRPHFSQTTTMGVVIPLSNLAEKNRFGFHSGTVVEADLSPDFFVRVTWDFFQLRYKEKTMIGNQSLDIYSNNNGNAFYVSSGFQKAKKRWKYYGFAGSGLTLLNDPKCETVLWDNTRFSYLSNQNAQALSLDLGIGTAYRRSNKEQFKIEINLFFMPNLREMTYLSLQLAYHLYLNNPKNTSFFTN